VSSPASRQRQRHRRRAREKLWATQKDLADRQVDLVSYERVIVDMTTRRQLAPFGGEQAITLVTICRDVTAQDCVRLAEIVADLEKSVDDHAPSDPEETLHP
jgi:hypothetical protein